MYHIDWFACVEESLHLWSKPNLIMVYELFVVLLNYLLEFCWGFLHLCSSVILACSFLFLFIYFFSFVFVWFWLSEWWWHWGMNLEVFLSLQFFLIFSFSSVQFRQSVVSDSLQPHELQYARPPCSFSTISCILDSVNYFIPLKFFKISLKLY